MELIQFKNRIDRKTSTKFLSKVDKDIFMWYSHNPDQRSLIFVDDLRTCYNKDDLGRLARFGILDTNGRSEAIEREYLIPIEEQHLLDLEAYVREYSKTQLKGEMPTYYVLVHNPHKAIANIDEYDELTGHIENLIHGIKLFNPDYDLRNSRCSQEVIDELIESYKQVGFTNFIDITDLVERITESYEVDNTFTILEFQNAVTEIKSKYTRNSMIYCRKENDCFINLAAHLLYFENISCMFVNRGGKFRVALGQLCYSPHRMLAGDRIEYLRNFPTYSLKTTDYSAFGFIVGARTGDRRLEVNLTMCEMDELETGEVITEDVNFNHTSLTIEDVVELKGLRVATKEKLAIVNNSLRDLFIKFYHRLPSKDVIPNPCNTLFLTDEFGKTYMALINNIDFRVKGILRDINLNMITLDYEVTESEVPAWLPVELFIDGTNMRKHLEQVYYVLNGKKGVPKYITPDRTRIKPMTSIFRGFYMNRKNATISRYNVEDFVELCLNCEDSVKFRTFEGQEFLKRLNKEKELMSKLNCFFGYDMLITSKILITEKTYTRGI